MEVLKYFYNEFSCFLKAFTDISIEKIRIIFNCKNTG